MYNINEKEMVQIIVYRSFCCFSFPPYVFFFSSIFPPYLALLLSSATGSTHVLPDPTEIGIRVYGVYFFRWYGFSFHPWFWLLHLFRLS